MGSTPGRGGLTACIIARDEAERLPACLASVAFCDEVIVMDSGSRDATVQIARRAGARVHEHAWLGFAAQRNLVLDLATTDWILEVDADERVTAALRDDIQTFLADPPAGVEIAGVPRREIFLGRRLGPSAKYPKYRHRLFRRGVYRHPEGRTVHEGLIPSGPVHPLTGDLEHLLAGGLGEAIRDTWSYARLEAGQMTAAKSPGTVLRGALLRPAAKLVYRLTVDGGWRDGVQGFAHIALDCGTDSVVWLRHVLGRRGPVTGDSGVPPGAHYGSRRRRAGSRRVVAVACGGPASERALAWLQAARVDGADVVLVSDTAMPGAPAGGVRVRRLAAPRPVPLLRALDAEAQLRTYDELRPFGRRARLLLRLVPGGLRGLEAS